MGPLPYVSSYYAASAHPVAPRPALGGSRRVRRVRRRRRHRGMLGGPAPGRTRPARGAARSAAHWLGRFGPQRRAGAVRDRRGPAQARNGSSAQQTHAPCGMCRCRGSRSCASSSPATASTATGRTGTCSPRSSRGTSGSCVPKRTSCTDKYGYTSVRYLSREELRALLATERYLGALYDSNSGHLHPLNYTLGLATAAQGAGVRIFEATRALRYAAAGTGQVRISTADGEAACPAPGAVRQRLPGCDRARARREDHGGRNLHRRHRALRAASAPGNSSPTTPRSPI